MQGLIRAVVLTCAALSAAAPTVLRAESPPATSRGPASQPAEAAKPAEAIKPPPAVQRVVDDLLASKVLRLSTDAGSPVDGFHFRFALRPPADVARPPTEVLVGRRKEKLGIVASSIATQLPFAYIRDGLMVRLDPERPGGLIAHEGGRASFTFGMGPDGPVGDFGYTAEAGGKSGIVADPGAVLAGLTGRLAAAKYDEPSRTLQARTVRGAGVRLTLAGEAPAAHPAAQPAPAVDDAARYPIDMMAMVAPNGMGVILTAVQLAPPPEAFVGATLDDVRKLGLPVRLLDDKEVGRVSLFPTADLGKNEPDREASRKLASLLEGRAP